MTFHYTNLLWISFGVVVGGTSVLVLGSVVMGTFQPLYFAYVMVAWFWIRCIDLNLSFIFKKPEDVALRFAYAWLAPIAILLVFGILRIPLPIYVLALFGFADFLFKIFSDIRRHFLRVVGGTLCGVILGVMMAVITAQDSFPWQDTLTLGGIGYVDSFRDAATTMGWYNYATISHGVHGLLFEPYHSLSAWLVIPFMRADFGVFSVFNYLSFIAIPGVLIYGASMLISTAPTLAIRQRWPVLLLVFIFSVSCFNYVFTQRSVMIATLLSIGLVPILAKIIFATSTVSRSTIAVLALVLPVLLFARAFNGLLLSILIVPMLFIRMLPARYLLVTSLMVAGAILVFFFGATERAAPKFFIGLGQFLTRPMPWFISGWYLLMLPILILCKERFGQNGLKFKEVLLDRYYLTALLLCVATFMLLMRAEGPSDAFYQALPAFFWLFFALLLAPADIYERHFGTGPLTNGLGSGAVLILLSLAILTPTYFQTLSERSAMAQITERKAIQQMVRASKVSDDAMADSPLCSSQIQRLLCELRERVFGGFDVAGITRESLPHRMAVFAMDRAQEMDGVTGVYVAPHHPYWGAHFKDGSTPAMYFMAIAGVPQIYGAPEKNSNPAYSIMSAHGAGGTSRSLAEIGGIAAMCDDIQKLHVDNVVIFDQYETSGQSVRCADIE